MMNQFTSHVNRPVRSGPKLNSQQRGRGRGFFFFQEKEEVSSFSQSQLPQHSVEILSPQNCSHIHPVIKLLHVENI